MDIRLLADQILEIGCDDYEEQGIPDDLDNSSVETSEHGDEHVTNSCEDDSPNKRLEGDNEEIHDEAVVNEVIEEICGPTFED